MKLGYPKDEIKIVEALRHLYLNKFINDNEKKEQNISKNKLSILILGDYLYENTEFQLQLLNNLPEEILTKLRIIFKPHPACPINQNLFTNIKMNIRQDYIANLIPSADVAYCSSSTSAAADLYSCGKKVIIASDPGILNLSPLRGFEEVDFVSNSNELKNIIIKLLLKDSFSALQRCIFEISNELPLWRELLYK